MARPTCNMCNGTGKQERTSFRTPRKTITGTCTYCHGRKVVPVTVDVYDIIEHLWAMPFEEWSPADVADWLERKWGSPKESDAGKER